MWFKPFEVNVDGVNILPNRWEFPAAMRLKQDRPRSICPDCEVTMYDTLLADMVAERSVQWLKRVDEVLEARDR